MNIINTAIGLATVVFMAAAQITSAQAYCRPKITEVHNAMCVDLDNNPSTMNDNSCEVHIRGQCLTNYDNNPDTNRHRVLIADNDMFKQAEWFVPSVSSATDLHFRIKGVTIQQGVLAVMSSLSLEGRLFKLQKRSGRRWVDEDTQLVTFIVPPAMVGAPGVIWTPAETK
ncbi:MAG: hypothetical protein EBS79_04495 [Gammaproteobacteria bacterium]|nr:hypothetical protein [Gammaproteobacteria bacterium]NBY22426.1 hypothetical protein [Gammaproteobacteria bacterium]